MQRKTGEKSWQYLGCVPTWIVGLQYNREKADVGQTVHLIQVRSVMMNQAQKLISLDVQVNPWFIEEEQRLCSWKSR